MRHSPFSALDFYGFYAAFASSRPGLPDGLYPNQKSQFGLLLEDLKLKNVYKIYVLLDSFTDIWDIL
jgi:hypothetical protein